MRNIKEDVYWYSLKDPKPGESFSGNLKTKFAVIGGGMAGLTCAQKLHESGQEVVLIERDFCGAGASGKSSGFITPDSEIELSSLLKNYGAIKAKRIWEFDVSGLENIRQNIERYKISCDYQVQDSLFVANDAAGFKHIRHEYEARKTLGYQSTLYDQPKIKQVIGAEYHGAVRYPDTFGMNSYLYCQAMKDVLRADGVQIFEQTEVEKISGHDIIIAGGRITAEHIVVCTDLFIPELGLATDEIYHVQTFLGITKPLSSEQVRVIFPKENQGNMMVWDTDLIYSYFRLTGDNRLLIGGGDLLYTYAKDIATNTGHFKKLLKSYIHKKFPSVDIEIEYCWPGMLGVSKDFLPVIGTDEKNDCVFYVGAATGLPWASALGVYAADHFLNGRKEFDKDFSPRRHFVIGRRMQALLRTKATYALSHGIAKYF